MHNENEERLEHDFLSFFHYERKRNGDGRAKARQRQGKGKFKHQGHRTGAMDGPKELVSHGIEMENGNEKWK
jgi:hypothetical protein